MVAYPIGSSPEQSAEKAVVTSIPEHNEIESTFIRTFHNLLCRMSSQAFNFN
jgi:hypothetical protein